MNFKAYSFKIILPCRRFLPLQDKKFFTILYEYPFVDELTCGLLFFVSLHITSMSLSEFHQGILNLTNAKKSTFMKTYSTQSWIFYKSLKIWPRVYETNTITTDKEFTTCISSTLHKMYWALHRTTWMSICSFQLVLCMYTCHYNCYCSKILF